MEINIPLRQISMETKLDDKRNRGLNNWAALGPFQVNTQRKTWKIFTQCIQIRSGWVKFDNFIA